MFLNDFFYVAASEETAEGLKVRVRLNPDHAVFSGHFPGNPVTPGVMELQIVKELLEQKHSRQLQMLSMPRCKYLNILNPVQCPEFDVKIQYAAGSASGQLSISASGEHGDQVFFKFNATYR
jgi:3-hydroxyacyl-[acyl-carrier-protein] dehydratase